MFFLDNTLYIIIIIIITTLPIVAKLVRENFTK